MFVSLSMEGLLLRVGGGRSVEYSLSYGGVVGGEVISKVNSWVGCCNLPVMVYCFSGHSSTAYLRRKSLLCQDTAFTLARTLQ